MCFKSTLCNSSPPTYIIIKLVILQCDHEIKLFCCVVLLSEFRVALKLLCTDMETSIYKWAAVYFVQELSSFTVGNFNSQFICRKLGLKRLQKCYSKWYNPLNPQLKDVLVESFIVFPFSCLPCCVKLYLGELSAIL